MIARMMDPYLGDGSCENDNFIEFTDPLHKLIDTRPLDDVDIVEVALYLHWYREVRLV